MFWSIWIGFEPREAAAYAVARSSLQRYLTSPIPVHGLVLGDLVAAGLYSRPTERRVTEDGAVQLWDTISDAPMSTEFACSRFLVPHLAQQGWALFMDCDMLVRDNIVRLFEQAEASRDKAVLCVKHDHRPMAERKMHGQAQTVYPRKNWSSLMLFNCDHEANRRLTVEMANTLPGRDLHRFCWLDDDEIGEIDPEWNWLAGHSDPTLEPKIVHHTEGSPCLPGCEAVPFADEWRAALTRWAI